MRKAIGIEKNDEDSNEKVLTSLREDEKKIEELLKNTDRMKEDAYKFYALEDTRLSYVSCIPKEGAEGIISNMDGVYYVDAKADDATHIKNDKFKYNKNKYHKKSTRTGPAKIPKSPLEGLTGDLLCLNQIEFVDKAFKVMHGFGSTGF